MVAIVAAACGGSAAPTPSAGAERAIVADVVAHEAAAVPGPAPQTGAGAAATTPPTSAAEAVPASAAECDGSMVFEHPPVDLDAIEAIVPLGLMYDSHVTPVDHQYFQNFRDPDRWIDVFSPGAGRVTSIQHMNAPVADVGSYEVDDYRLVIEHSCTISSIFIHVGSLSPRLAEVAPEPGRHASVDVTVEAGEPIGVYQRNVDYNVVDLDFTTDRLLVPEHYAAEPWKIHTPDPFAYFTDEIRSRMESLSLRSAEPRGGVFAYDVDGRLLGNWFVAGSGGYGGVGPPRYWSTHLAVAYDHLDPSTIVVSLGDFDGRSRQFGVAGNAPDPADVSVDDGVVAYELVELDYWVDGARWDRVGLVSGIAARGYDQVHGVVLFELVDDRTLRVEVLPGADVDSVTGFTESALTYER